MDFSQTPGGSAASNSFNIQHGHSASTSLSFLDRSSQTNTSSSQAPGGGAGGQAGGGGTGGGRTITGPALVGGYGGHGAPYFPGHTHGHTGAYPTTTGGGPRNPGERDRDRERERERGEKGDKTQQQTPWLADNSEQISPFDPSTMIQSSNSNDESSSSLYFSRPNLGPKLNSRVGNYNYSCPEIVIGTGYDHTADWWAVGILCFHFLAGITPFEAKTQEETMENIVTFRAAWDLLPETVSNECKHFMASIFLPRHSEDRLGYDESITPVLSHTFFADIDIYSLYEGYGPLYPEFTHQPNSSTGFSNLAVAGAGAGAGAFGSHSGASGALAGSASHLSLFTLLTTQEMNEIPDFAGRYAREKEEEENNTQGGQADFRAIYYEGFEDFTYYS
jgi:serine/threonine protein kinase